MDDRLDGQAQTDEVLGLEDAGPDTLMDDAVVQGQGIVVHEPEPEEAEAAETDVEELEVAEVDADELGEATSEEPAEELAEEASEEAEGDEPEPVEGAPEGEGGEPEHVEDVPEDEGDEPEPADATPEDETTVLDKAAETQVEETTVLPRGEFVTVVEDVVAIEYGDFGLITDQQIEWEDPVLERENRSSYARILASIFLSVAALACVLIALRVSGVLGGSRDVAPEQTQEAAEQTTDENASEEEQQSSSATETEQLAINGALLQAREQADAEDYEGAIATIEKVLEVYPNSKELSDVLKTYKDAFEQQKVELANKQKTETKYREKGKKKTEEEVTGTVDRSRATIYVSNTSSGVNLRQYPRYASDLVGSASGNENLYWSGSTGTGQGSDGATYTWLYVETESGQRGFVRSDLVHAKSQTESTQEENKPEETTAPASGEVYRSNGSDGVNLRSEPKYKSDVNYSAGANEDLHYTGTSGMGAGSDGQTYTWLYVTTSSGQGGYVRSDLVHRV